ncbi:unnamed protein product [Cladocopium goreaui]|uniref:Methyltransferase domain-containing protein n=1 Tax=Cladocopium goreaui TaxID=2562237 RepID=A0A9P1C4S0_9DINO|nr:unnamed protein product [Cladocopium goreaui]
MAASPLSYGDGSTYWDKRYLTKASPDEWLLAWSQVADVFEKYCDQPRRQWQILHAGCGNSALTAEMYRAGYEHITSIDNSATVIAQMQAACRDSASLKWCCMDAGEMDFDDGSFDVVIEKGLLDCLGCMDEAKLEVAKVLKEVHRVLRLQGLFFCISFNHNRAAQLAEPWKFSPTDPTAVPICRRYVFRKSSADVLQWPQLFRDLKLHLTKEDYQLVDQPCTLTEGEAETGNVVEVIEACESGDQNPVGLHVGLRGVVKLSALPQPESVLGGSPGPYSEHGSQTAMQQYVTTTM